MAVGDAQSAPTALGGALGVFDEVGHVFRRLAQVEGGNVFEAGRLAEAHEVQDAPAVGGIRIPRAVIGRPPVPRADHLLPAVVRGIDHGAAVTQDGVPLVDQCLRDVTPDRQVPEAAP